MGNIILSTGTVFAFLIFILIFLGINNFRLIKKIPIKINELFIAYQKYKFEMGTSFLGIFIYTWSLFIILFFYFHFVFIYNLDICFGLLILLDFVLGLVIYFSEFLIFGIVIKGLDYLTERVSSLKNIRYRNNVFISFLAILFLVLLILIFKTSLLNKYSACGILGVGILCYSINISIIFQCIFNPSIFMKNEEDDSNKDSDKNDDSESIIIVDALVFIGKLLFNVLKAIYRAAKFIPEKFWKFILYLDNKFSGYDAWIINKIKSILKIKNFNKNINQKSQNENNTVCVSLALSYFLIIIMTIFSLYFIVLFTSFYSGYNSSKLEINNWTLLYYTVITFTTVGFGDITPTGFWGQSVAILISISSVICLVLFVTTAMDTINKYRKNNTVLKNEYTESMVKLDKFEEKDNKIEG